MSESSANSLKYFSYTYVGFKYSRTLEIIYHPYEWYYQKTELTSRY